jgi:hypothetical protein
MSNQFNRITLSIAFNNNYQIKCLTKIKPNILINVGRKTQTNYNSASKILAVSRETQHKNSITWKFTENKGWRNKRSITSQ